MIRAFQIGCLLLAFAICIITQRFSNEINAFANPEAKFLLDKGNKANMLTKLELKNGHYEASYYPKKSKST